MYFLAPLAAALYAPSITSLNTPKTFVSTQKSFFRLGDQVLQIDKFSSTESLPYQLVSLHNDETNLIASARSFVSESGGSLVLLNNKGNRKVEATLMDHDLQFDPSFIFTTWGRKQALDKTHTSDRRSSQQLEQFARFLITALEEQKITVELHAQCAGSYTIASFKKDGALEKTARIVYENPAQDPSSYFITNSQEAFDRLKARQQNVVYQNLHGLKDDGSLKIYFLRAAKPYVQVVSVKDQEGSQLRLLNSLKEALQ
jgi:hypothetical protein